MHPFDTFMSKWILRDGGSHFASVEAAKTRCKR